MNPQSSTAHKLPRLNVVQPTIKAYFISHGRAFLLSLHRLARSPLESLMILAVIGIALALPAGLFVMLQNLQQVSENWGQETKISLFLKTTVHDVQATQLATRLKLEKGIASVNYVTPEQGMERISKQAGFAQALSQLNDNPLPGLIEILPAKTAQDPALLEALVQQLQKLPEVDVVQLDMDWVKRLHSLLKLGSKVAYALTVFFAIAVFLIIGNTVHLAIQNQRREIEVFKLVGATHAFIRRPFLYRGMMYGVMGAIFAGLLISLGLFWLNDTAMELAAEYHSAFTLFGLGTAGLGALLFGGIVLGLSAAWLAVNHYLRLAN